MGVHTSVQNQDGGRDRKKVERPDLRAAFSHLLGQSKGSVPQPGQLVGCSSTAGTMEGGSRWEEMQAPPSDFCAQSRVGYSAVLYGGCGWSAPHRWPHSLHLGRPYEGEHHASEAMRREAKCFNPSAPFLGEGRRGWSWKPREQLMLFPERGNEVAAEAGMAGDHG